MPKSSKYGAGGWHRIGIATSILWLIVGAFWGYKVGDFEANRANVQWRFDCRSKYGSAVEAPPSKAPVTASDPTGAPATLDMSTIKPDEVDGIPVKSPPTIPSITDKYGRHLLLNPDQQKRLVDAYQRADDWCDQQSQQLWPTLNRNTWRYSALYSLVPIPLGWLVAFCVVALVRWIRAGFSDPTSPH
jgi:hypothetical protein